MYSSFLALPSSQPSTTRHSVAWHGRRSRPSNDAGQIDEVKDIRDKARAIEVYARQAKNVEAERQACEIRLRAERRAGQLISDMDKAKGGRPTETPNTMSGVLPLAELGISHKQSSDWQKLAAIPVDTFEADLADPMWRPTLPVG
jgi:hypothetical protein